MVALIRGGMTPRFAKPKMARPEQEMQAAIFQWMRLHEKVYPQLAYAHAIPNGGFRTKVEAAILKRTGVKAGISDICFPWPGTDLNGCRYAGMYMELKAPGNPLTEEQERFLRFVSTNGFLGVCVNNFDAAIARIKAYLGPPR
jgi:hypothetical protein